ncbi:MAG: hypothetical protein V4693_17125 [Pseudomonadota bacterium]
MPRLLMLAILLLMHAPTKASINTDHSQKVFDLISNQEIYRTSLATLLKNLQPLCHSRANSTSSSHSVGNIDCDQTVGASSFQVSTDQDLVSMLTATFEQSSQCLRMMEKLVATFGKPTKYIGNCHAMWLLPTPDGYPQRYVGIQASPEANKVFFSIGEEQGP